jgi:N12 class adenine-specific DNA methylase
MCNCEVVVEEEEVKGKHVKGRKDKTLAKKEQTNKRGSNKKLKRLIDGMKTSYNAQVHVSL